MDGKYLASNIGPLKSIADGSVLKVINAILDDRNENRDEADNGAVIAYKIRDSKLHITRIECLINTPYGLHYRSFSLYNGTGTIDDDLRKSANYGYGIHDVMLENFIVLRDWYLQNKEVPAEV